MFEIIDELSLMGAIHLGFKLRKGQRKNTNKGGKK